MAAASRQLRTLLVLGRISNLPTVWSNCLAAWLLNGGGAWTRFGIVCSGASFLYVGGMFLNDAFDADYDRRFRRERPIPSSHITVRAVWLSGTTALLLGWLLLSSLGVAVSSVALLLVGAIVLYDAVHKRTAFAPLLMASCRFLLYLVAASATLRAVDDSVVWHGLALAAYITGLSFLARAESGHGMVRHWPLLLLIAPVVAGVITDPYRDAMAWTASLLVLVWLFWCLRSIMSGSARFVGRSVADLLAGIVLVDWAAVPRQGSGYVLAFAALFGLALVLQRRIPAT